MSVFLNLLIVLRPFEDKDNALVFLSFVSDLSLMIERLYFSSVTIRNWSFGKIPCVFLYQKFFLWSIGERRMKRELKITGSQTFKKLGIENVHAFEVLNHSAFMNTAMYFGH